MDLSQPSSGVSLVSSLKTDMPSRPVYSYDSEFWMESTPPYTWPPTPSSSVARDSALTNESHNLQSREPIECPTLKVEPLSTNETISSEPVPADKWPSVASQVSASLTSMNLTDPNTSTARPEGPKPGTEVPKLPDILSETQLVAVQQSHMRRLIAAAPGSMMPPGGGAGGEGGQSDLFHKVPLGEKGRMELKAAIRAAMKERPELREKVNHIAKLRCATIPQLLRIAHICDLWDMALEISRRFVETRNGKQSRQAAIRKMAKSGCLIDRRLPPPISTMAIAAAQQVTAMPINKSHPVRLLPKPVPTLMTTVFTPGPSVDFRPALCDSTSVVNGTTSPGTSASQTSAGSTASATDEAPGAWPMQANPEPGYAPAVAEWQPLDQPYYDIYGNSGVYAGTATSSNPTQWAAPPHTSSNPHPTPSYYPSQAAPSGSASSVSETNTAAPVPPESHARVDGVCLFAIDQTLASGVPPSISPSPNENPAVEHLAAISQFGLWAAEATPGFV